MDNKFEETEQEKKDKMRKEILDELNNNSNINSTVDSNIQAFGRTKKQTAVNFNRKEESDDVQVNNKEVNQPTGGNKGLLIICAIVIIVAVICFPFISKKIDDIKYKSKPDESIVSNKQEEKVYYKITLESDEVQNLKYPVMHIDNENKNTYYSKDKVSISDFNNKDILYNALIQVYSGSFEKYNGSYNGNFCGGNNKVAVDQQYLKLRIENSYTKNLDYKNEDFSVPVSSDKTKYVGTWKYDATNKRYVYYGNCGAKKSNTLYYDIQVPYDANSSDKNIEIYVYSNLAFVTVDSSNNSYVVYSDYNYSKEITKGTLKTNDYEKELESIVKAMSKDSLGKYKYTYTIKDCPYQDYCFISGEWVK